MGKKVREYRSGDFIFAKVKGYPAWPARVQKNNGKKYFVYFYGTGETANLPPNMIFDYAENKEKFLSKSVKRKDFNDGVRQIENDFVNNVPLEDVIGIAAEQPADKSINNTVNESTVNDTIDESMADTTVADETAPMEATPNTTQNAGGVEDSDEAGTLIIDEGKKGRKSKAETPKPPAKGKDPKTPRGRNKKEEPKEEAEKTEEEIVSRSGRKIRPKRYMDEQIEENTTLPSPAPKKRKAASPAPVEKETEKPDVKGKDKSKQYNPVSQAELEDLKEPFKTEDDEKENILVAYIPSGQYVGIKLTELKSAGKNDAAKLAKDKAAAAQAIALKSQLEKGHITAQSIAAQLVMDLNLTDEQKATLDKEREMVENKSRVQFLKTEIKLIELNTKVKTCVSLERADTELCLKLLDELSELDVKPLMFLKHPTCLETVKRMRAYVGNTPSWEMSEEDAALFGKQAHHIRRRADNLYNCLKKLFTIPEGLSFWEYFSERVLQFKKVTANLDADELLEMVHEPLEMSVPTSHTMKSAIEAANETEPPPADDEEAPPKKKATAAKSKKSVNNSTPSKPSLKRQSSRKQEEKEKEANKKAEEETEKPAEEETAKEDKKEESDITENSTNEAKERDSSNTEEVVEEKENTTDKEESAPQIEEEKVEEVNKEVVEEQKTAEGDKASGDSKDDEKKDSKASEKMEVDEPRAKRSRDSKKTEPPVQRSPAKRKAKP